MFVNAVSSPLDTPTPMITATGSNAHVPGATTYPIGTRIVSSVAMSVCRSVEPRSMSRPKTGYPTICVADCTIASVATKAFDASKWSTSMIGKTAKFMRFPVPKIENASSSLR